MAGTFTPELGAAICDQLATGDKSLRQIAREFGIPHSNILFWALKEPSFADQYARACEVGDDAAFEKLIDDATEAPKAANGTVDSGWVQWKKLQIDTMKWVLARKRPKKYGDRTILSGDADNPIMLSTVLAEARKRIADTSGDE